MKLYHRISLAVSAIVLAVWASAYVLYRAPMASDGTGPDPLGLLLFFSSWLVGAILLQSTVATLLLSRKKHAATTEVQYGAGINAAMWVILALCLYR